MTRDSIALSMALAAEHLQTYDQLLVSSATSGTRFTYSFTPFDDPLYEAFRRHFPDLNIADLGPVFKDPDLQSKAAKWEPVRGVYESLNRAYGGAAPAWNYFGILRQISTKFFSQPGQTTFRVCKGIEICIEIARIKEGMNVLEA